MKSRFLGILSLLVLVLALTACDGSSGSSSSSSSGASGAVASAPLTDAEVWSYDANGVAIQIGKTTSDGSIEFGSGLSNVKFPNAIVFSKHGKSFVNTKAATFAGTLKGVMASSTSAVYLTPANTLVAALVEQGLPFEDAKGRVKKAVNAEMGVNIDPFANPLDQLTESEIVSQTIFAVLGIREEAAGDLGECMKTIATGMAAGNTFGKAVRTVPTCPMKTPTESMFAFVKKVMKTDIMPQVKKVLSSADGSDTRFDAEVILKEEKTIEAATQPEVPVAIVIAAGSKNTPAEFYTAIDTVSTLEFTFAVLNSKPNAAGEPVPFALDAPDSKGLIELVNFSGVGKVAANDSNVFTYTLNPDDYNAADLPLGITITIGSVADKTVTKTINATIVSKNSIVVEELDFTGKPLFTFENTAKGKIVDGSSHALTDKEFVAQIELVTANDDFKDNVDVRFFAPTGFKFDKDSDGTANTASYTVKDLTIDSSDSTKYTAEIMGAKSVSLIAVLDKDATPIEPGRKEMSMQVIDTKNDNAVLKTASSSIFFVPTAMKDDLKGATLTKGGDNNGLTITTKPIAKGDTYAHGNLSLEGSYKTWVNEADPKANAGGRANFPGKVVLMSTSGAKVFKDSTGTGVAKLDVTAVAKDDFTFTADITDFKYIYNDANDDIKMVFMLDDSNNNIESSNVLKLRFDPKAPAPAPAP